MDLKLTFHNLLRKNILMKKYPNFCHKISGYFASLRSIASIYNFISRHNKNSIFERKQSTEYFKNQKEKIEQNISFLADDLSKEIYTNLLFYRCTAKNKYVFPFSRKYTQQYLDKLITFAPLKKFEVFVDAGSFLENQQLRSDVMPLQKSMKAFIFLH